MPISAHPWRHGTNGASAFVYDADGMAVAKIQPQQEKRDV